MSRQREIYNTNDQCQRATGEMSHQTNKVAHQSIFAPKVRRGKKKRKEKKKSLFFEI